MVVGHVVSLTENVLRFKGLLEDFGGTLEPLESDFKP
jgi:hypothetical protein